MDTTWKQEEKQTTVHLEENCGIRNESAWPGRRGINSRTVGEGMKLAGKTWNKFKNCGRRNEAGREDVE